ncbi:hypothetical protein MHLP_02175 [Candidatus Mycoplasma haematolamae str. Purdue]|uniref:Uncharacterized protein n=1 Tax=Mycoplasma haematolamae (strain Purdue) TaxID=1212765 RepID=I7B9S7_MYCHA|nr:hypothetical protein [Candidatus Mycoplasma haematolamae]AFO52015.1 hypothetical protein MHLP_02175 [Candidatus Mycoplasma haematolamae str. Purdue]
MPFLPMKFTAMIVGGVGSVIGGGYGTIQYVYGRTPDNPLRRNEVKDSKMPSLISEADDQSNQFNTGRKIQLDSSETRSALVQQLSSSLEDDQEDDEEAPEETVKSEIKGKLAVVKGEGDEVWRDDYHLKVYFGEEEAENAVSFSIKETKEEIEKFVYKFNEDIWFYSSDVQGFLEKLNEKKSSLEGFFSEGIYLDLKSKTELLNR